jgi:hypothetical protein
MARGDSKNKESLDLAKEHIKIAQNNIFEISKNQEKKENNEKTKRILFFLERTESEIEELQSKIFGFFAITLFGGGFFLLSPTITGNTIDSSIKSNQPLIAIILIFIAIIFFFLWVNKKRKK